MDYTKFRTNPIAYSTSQATYDVGLRSFMVSVYRQMAIALAITAIISMTVSSSHTLMNMIFGTPLFYVVLFAPIALVFYLSAKFAQMSLESARNYLWLYAGLLGISLASIFQIYTGASIARVFFITSSMFGGMSIYGYTTKKDLSSMGSFMIMGVWGTLLASVFNMFMRSQGLDFIISVIGVIAFTGLTAYNTQQMKDTYYQLSSGDAEKVAVYGALTLYMNFINMFLSLLRLFGDRRN